MARLITAPDLQAWAGQAGEGPKYLLVQGLLLTPGAVDAARSLGVQMLYPGQALRTQLKRMAEEVTGGEISEKDLKELETRLLTTMKHRGGS